MGQSQKSIWARNITTLEALTNIPLIYEKKVGQLKIVFLSRITRKKNLAFALEALALLQFKVDFDIYGPIEDFEYWQDCQQIMSQLPSNVSCRFRGALEPSRIQSTLCQYDLFFLPTLGENYGHVIYEALSSGLPVLISDQTPWNELADYNAGWSNSLNDQWGFVNKLNLLAQMSHSEYMVLRESALGYARQKYKVTPLVMESRKLFELQTSTV